MKRILIGIALALVAILLLMRYNRPESNGGSFAAEKSLVPFGDQEKETVDSIPDRREKPDPDSTLLDHQSQLRDRHIRYGKAHSIIDRYKPKVKTKLKQQLSFFEKYPDGLWLEREVRGQSSGISREEAERFEQASRAVRDTEKEMFAELSHILLPEELLDFKLDHSVDGQVIQKHVAGYSRLYSVEFSRKDLQSLYQRHEKLYNILDSEFEGSKLQMEEFLDAYHDNAINRYEPLGPEYELMHKIDAAYEFEITAFSPDLSEEHLSEQKYYLTTYETPNPLLMNRLKAIFDSL